MDQAESAPDRAKPDMSHELMEVLYYGVILAVLIIGLVRF